MGLQSIVRDTISFINLQVNDCYWHSENLNRIAVWLVSEVKTCLLYPFKK